MGLVVPEVTTEGEDLVGLFQVVRKKNDAAKGVFADQGALFLREPIAPKPDHDHLSDLILGIRHAPDYNIR